MPRQIYTVELDGTQYDIEGDRPPTEQDVRSMIGQESQPIPTKSVEPSFPERMGQSYNKLTNMIPTTAQIAGNVAGFKVGGFPGMATGGVAGKGIGEILKTRYQKSPLNIIKDITTAGFPAAGTMMNTPLTPEITPTEAWDISKKTARVIPTEAAGALVGKGLTKAIPLVGKGISFLSGKGLPKQAETVASELENIRGVFGKAKADTIAKFANKPIKNIGDLSKDLSDLGLSNETALRLKDPMYRIEFLKDGSVNPTVGNMDKVATALGDMLSPSEWDKFSNVSKSTIKRAYGLVRKSITNTAPKTKSSVDAFHYFLDNVYNPTIRKVVQGGRNVEKPLRDALAMGAEQTTKQAISGAGQISPEIAKAIKYIKNYRRTMAGLKGAGVVGVGGGLWKGLSGN